jgi:hypothetical protein
MQIAGKWFRCSDGTTRPMVDAGVQKADGSLFDEKFLIDSGADVTVLSDIVWQQLGLPPAPNPPGFALAGISGRSAFVVVDTVLVFRRQDGLPARLRGRLAAFTQPTGMDYSILGRDVLDNFDVILGRQRREVILLAGNHQYQIAGP